MDSRKTPDGLLMESIRKHGSVSGPRFKHPSILKYVYFNSIYYYFYNLSGPVAYGESSRNHIDHFEAQIGRCGTDMFGHVFAHMNNKFVGHMIRSCDC